MSALQHAAGELVKTHPKHAARFVCGYTRYQVQVGAGHAVTKHTRAYVSKRDYQRYTFSLLLYIRLHLLFKARPDMSLRIIYHSGRRFKDRGVLILTIKRFLRFRILSRMNPLGLERGKVKVPSVAASSATSCKQHKEGCWRRG